MINAGKELKKGFLQLLETFGGQIVVHVNFNCDDSDFFEVKGMKNKKKEDSSDIFQFPDRLNVKIGDVVQQKNSSEFWKIYRTEENIVGDEFVYFILYVNKIDSNGNPA